MPGRQSKSDNGWSRIEVETGGMFLFPPSRLSGSNREEDMSVSQLGYLVLDVSDIDAWRDLATGIIGAEERQDEGADLVRLRFDEQHHRITLRRAKTDSVAAIGWEVP